MGVDAGHNAYSTHEPTNQIRLRGWALLWGTILKSEFAPLTVGRILVLLYRRKAQIKLHKSRTDEEIIR